MISAGKPASNLVKRVFMSYARGSEDHRTSVRKLWSLLRSSGVDAHYDDMYTVERRDWFAWVVDQVDRADYVIVVVCPRYRAVGDGNGPAEVSRGVQTESAVLRDRLYRDRNWWLPRLLPVILPGRNIEEIPEFLQPYSASHYRICEYSARGVSDLLRTIAGRSIDLSKPVDSGSVAVADVAAGRVEMHAKVGERGRVYQAGRDQSITER